MQQTEEFEQWFERLRDGIAQKRIAARIARIEIGLFGDVKPVGGKVSELRIDHGPGYRVYFTRVGETIILLLVGGDKSMQERDIEKAKELAAQIDD